MPRPDSAFICKSISSQSAAGNMRPRREVKGRGKEGEPDQWESWPEVCWVIINGMKLQLAADIGYSKRSVSCCILHLVIWEGVTAAHSSPTRLGVACLTDPLPHSFLYSSWDLFSPFTQTCTHTLALIFLLTFPPPEAQSPETLPQSGYQGIRGFWMLLSQPSVFCQGPSPVQWHLEGQKGPVR